MRKLALGIATVWLLLVALIVAAAFPATARAAEIPSSVSGDYVGGGWSCRVLAYAHPAGIPSTVVEYHCTDPESIQRLGGRTWWGCPVTGVYAERLWPWWTSTVLAAPPDAHLTITSTYPGGMSVVINGRLVQFSLAQPIASPAPYPGCGGKAPGRWVLGP